MFGQAEQGGGVHDDGHFPTRHSRDGGQVTAVVAGAGVVASRAGPQRGRPEEEVGEHVRAALIQAAAAVLLGMGVVGVVRLSR